MTILEIIEPNLLKRRAGAKPRFEPPVHHCPECGRDWLCPDRYTEDGCGPMKHFPNANTWTCSPCISKDLYGPAELAAWWEANGAEERAA